MLKDGPSGLRAHTVDDDRRVPALLLGLVAGAVLLRLLVLWRFAPWQPAIESSAVLMDDAGDYHQLAQCLLQGHFCDNTIRTPGYPALLASVYALVGVKPWAALVVHAFIDGLTMVMTFLLGRRLFSERVGLLGAALVGIDPTMLFTSSSLLTDSLFTLFVVGALHVLVRMSQQGRWLAGGLLLGLLLGLASLVRPVGQYLPIVLLPFVLFASGLSWPRRAGMALAMVAAFGTAIGPWLWRNDRLFGAPQLATVQGDALLNWQVAYHIAWRTGEPIDSVRARLTEEVARAGAREEVDPFLYGRVAQQVALRHIRAEPWAYVLTNLRGVAFMYANLGTRVIAERLRIDTAPPPLASVTAPWTLGAMVRRVTNDKPLALVAVTIPQAIVQYAGYLLAIAGLVRLVRRREKLYAAALIVALVGYFAVVAGPIGQPRYKMPSTPGHLLLAAVALAAYGSARPRLRSSIQNRSSAG